MQVFRRPMQQIAETYPPLNTLSTVWCCGAECGRLNTGFGATTDQLHYKVISGSVGFLSFDTTVNRATGARCFKIAVSGSLSATQIAHYDNSIRDWTLRLYWRLESWPANDSYIYWTGLQTDAQIVGLCLDVSTQKLHCAYGISPPIMGATGYSISLNTWYRIDIQMDRPSIVAQVDGTTITGVTHPSASWSASDSNLNHIGLAGPFGTMTHYFDDMFVTGDKNDYPLGAGRVARYSPNSDGTHNTGAAGSFIVGSAGANITNATTNSYQLIDELPLDDITPDTNDYITQTNNTGGGALYVEHGFGNLDGFTPTQNPRHVEVCEAYHQAGNGASCDMSMRIADNGTESVVKTETLVGTSSTNTQWARNGFPNPPSGFGGWKLDGTNGNFNLLKHRFGYSTDANPDVCLDTVIIEAEFPE